MLYNNRYRSTVQNLRFTVLCCRELNFQPELNEKVTETGVLLMFEWSLVRREPGKKDPV